jgi:ubiquinone/menaquinone biosynthesis C-methylase UbiE
MGDDYKPFPDIGRRNLTQSWLEVPLMARALALPRGIRLLEIGCGRGAALVPLARCCAPVRLAGVDVDVVALAKAATHLSDHGVNCDLLLGDVRSLPFNDNSFDLVVDFGTCYHISRPEEALVEVQRVLADGGQFVYETRISQLMSHPVRSFGRVLPWRAASSLKPSRRRLLWSSRVRA